MDHLDTGPWRTRIPGEQDLGRLDELANKTKKDAQDKKEAQKGKHRTIPRRACYLSRRSDRGR